MKKLVIGAAVAGAALVGLRAAVRHCGTMRERQCGSQCADSGPCT